MHGKAKLISKLPICDNVRFIWGDKSKNLLLVHEGLPLETDVGLCLSKGIRLKCIQPGFADVWEKGPSVTVVPFHVFVQSGS